MPIDIATLAGTAVAFLVPFAPYLKETAGAFTKKFAEKLGEDVAKQTEETAPKLWEKVKRVFTSEEDIITLGLFEKNAPRYEGAIKEILVEKMNADPTLVEEFDKIVNHRTADGQSIGAQIFSAYNAGILDMRGATVGGKNNIVAGQVIRSGPPAKEEEIGARKQEKEKIESNESREELESPRRRDSYEKEQ